MFRKIFLLTVVLVLFVGAVAAQTDSSPAKSDAAAASEPKSPARFTPSKAQIQAGQEFLKGKKLYSGEASGKYNDETRAAIRVFQKDNGLAVTGNFNQITLEKMNVPLTDKQKGTSPMATSPATAGLAGPSPRSPRAAATPASASDSSDKAAPAAARTSPAAADGPKKPAPFQATKDQIMALQKILKDGKMFAGEANGERSDALKEAVKKYQEANGLKATGGINAVTLEKMGIPLTDSQKANVAAQAAYDAGKKN